MWLRSLQGRGSVRQEAEDRSASGDEAFWTGLRSHGPIAWLVLSPERTVALGSRGCSEGPHTGSLTTSDLFSNGSGGQKSEAGISRPKPRCGQGQAPSAGCGEGPSRLFQLLLARGPGLVATSFHFRPILTWLLRLTPAYKDTSLDWPPR